MRSITPASGLVINEYLYSTQGTQFDSYTLDADAVTTTDSDSKKYLDKGVVLAKITSPATASGLVGPYLTTATDGRQLSYNIVGINDTFADCSQGDVEIGCLVSGTVKEDALYMSSTSKNGTLPGAYKDLLRTATLDILVK
jgi:hypothetical protein